MYILGIETSCDETGVAIYHPDQGIVADELYSQVSLHQPYGGVVPELASRDHIRMTLPLVEHALAAAGLRSDQLAAIAYTAGPGLAGSLLVGAAVAQGIAHALSVPAIAVNHLEGHLLAPMLETKKPSYPFLALLVSGGHTLLVQVQAWRDYQVLGETLDDAAGEAFDKIAKMIGLPYPGGAPLSQLATRGNAERFDLPRPMTDRPGLDFSFSGLKTAALTTWRAHKDSYTDEDSENDTLKPDLAASFVAAVIDTLVLKCKRAIEQTQLQQFVVAGGVGANQQLRQQLAELGKKYSVEFFFPRGRWCTDNGAMIAYAGFLQWQQDATVPSASFEIYPRWPLAALSANLNKETLCQ